MERQVDQSVNFGLTRFTEDIQTVRMVDRSGLLDECNSSKAQIRTLLEEQRQMIIAEHLEKVSHHEIHAAHAEEERRLVREELWRQKLEFREAHQTESYRNGGITKIPKFYLRDDRETENLLKIRTLFWNYQAEYRNSIMK